MKFSKMAMLMEFILSIFPSIMKDLASNSGEMAFCRHICNASKVAIPHKAGESHLHFLVRVGERHVYFVDLGNTELFL